MTTSDLEVPQLPVEVPLLDVRSAMADPEIKRADRLLLIGTAILGTFLLGPLTIPLFVVAFKTLNRLARDGKLVRPWSVTLVALVVFLDASPNFFGWGMSLFPGHDTPIGTALITGWGKIGEGSNYIDYNSTPIGGIANPAVKSIQIWGVLLMYPMRMAAAWGFLKMKRWGLQMMIFTSFFQMAFWLGYVALYSLQFDVEAGASLFGPTALWAVSLPMTTCFVTLPYLLTLDRRRFTD